MFHRFIIPLAVLLLTACSTSRQPSPSGYPSATTGYVPQGILEERFYDCSVPGPSQRRVLVYLPADYYVSTACYPVLYLLHGARGNETSWIVKGDLLHNVDSLTSRGLMAKSIVVVPNTNQYNSEADFANSRIKDPIEALFENDGAVEHAFVDDVVRWVDRTYRTMPTKSARAIAGLSIGAMQSIHISANHPEMFGYVGLFSPMIHPIPRVSPYFSFYSKLKTKQKQQFATPPTLYWLMSGKSDIFYPLITNYHKYLLRKGFSHEYFTTPGTHHWDKWEEFCIMFLQKMWK